jgi:hypothetical protein
MAAAAGTFSSATGGAGFGSSTAVGYLDSAIPMNMLRIRYDAAYDNNRPDRAEFFYPKCGCFATLPPTNPNYDPRAPGPPKAETNVDYQELTSYLEYAPVERFSAFIEVPVRFINPTENENQTGIGDINFGAKFAFLYDPGRVATVQLRFFAPSGDGFFGLGTDHWTVEPSFLYYRKLTDKLTLEAELSDYIPFGGEPDGFAGNVLRYGVGISYLAYQGRLLRVTPVLETVGWTVLSGKELASDGSVLNASGDEIVNLKLGARIGCGEAAGGGVLNQSDIYIGYGRALTGDVWYKDIVRFELRLRF